MLVFFLGLAFWMLVCLADSAWYLLLASAKWPPPPLAKVLMANVPYWILVSLLTPAVVWVARRARFESGQRWRAIAIHIACLIPFAVLHVLLYRGVRLLQEAKPLFISDLLISTWKQISSTLDKEILLYLVIVGAVHALEYYRRFREKERAAAALELEQVRLEASLSEAKLESLKMQLQPHFLFNALHAISTLIMRGDSRKANQTLLHLSHFLRMTLDSTDGPVVPLAVELEFLDAYLRIQRERFGDRLQVNMDIDERALGAAVPNLILQPLVENSIRHGIGADPGSGAITIKAWEDDGQLHIQVLDNGPGLHGDRRPSERVGLGNVRARLQQLYPDAHSFTLEEAPAGGTVAAITIPLQYVRKGDAETKEPK